ncbi:MAG: DNA methyltransferase [Methylocella sp.]
MKRLASENRIWWGKDGNASFPLEKKFLSEAKEGVVQRTWWSYEYAGSTRNASGELKDVFGGKKPFDTPKPRQLIKRILEMFDDETIVAMDAFAGSGTTGHAVMEKNSEDRGTRRFVLVEMNPKVASEVTAVRLKNIVKGYDSTKNQKHVLKELQITLRNLKNAPSLVEGFEHEAAERSNEFDSVDVEFDGAALKLVGVRTAAQKAKGFGSGFRFCTLGEPLFDTDGNVGAAVNYSDLAAHVFFCDTGSPIPQRANGPLIDTFQGRAIYLLFAPASMGFPKPKAGNVLTAAALDALPLPEPGFNGPRVVYAEGCTVPDDRLASAGVTFRQVPYQIEGL